MLQNAACGSMRFMALRQKLFLVLSLMAMVPLLFLLFEVVESVETDLERRTSEELNATLGKMAKELDTLMSTQQSIVEGLARVPIVREFAATLEEPYSERFEAKAGALSTFFLNYQSAVPSIQALRFSDLQGKTLVKVKEGHLVPALLRDRRGRQFVEDIAYKPFFQWALDSNKRVAVSDFERGKVAGETDFCPAMVRYSVPIRDELDTPLGMLTVNIWGRRLDDAVQAALGGYPGKAYIVELNDEDAQRDGIYLYHENPDWRFANQLGSDHRLSSELGGSVWRAIKIGGISGVMDSTSDRWLYWRKFAPFADRATKWLLVIETNRDTVHAPIAGLRNWLTFLIVTMLVASLVIARWAAARLSRPVQELTSIIRRYADGDHGARYIDHRSDDVGSAGKAFNYLTESLERAKVERETAERAVQQSERLAAIGQMAAGIGHEINNPLMNITSLAGLLEESVPRHNRQGRDDLRALQSEVRRCARIVQGILNFARETAPSFERFDLTDLIETTVALFRHRADTLSLNLDLDISRPLPIEGDAGQLQQVLVNIVLNAIQASRPNSTITVRAHIAGDRARIEVLDEGSGINESALDKVFNPFFTTKPEGSGTGLGLSVSYGIVRRHGGTIALENRSRGGVRVQISVPLKHDVKPERAVEHIGASRVG